MKRKKKKKAKAKSTGTTATSSTVAGGPDEIDAALKSLSLQSPSSNANSPQSSNAPDPATTEICQLLAIDSHHLHVANEMKRLFGQAVFSVEREEDAAAAQARRTHGEDEGMGLAEAVKGKYSNAGAGLPAVLRRKNIFIQGKEDWPKGTSGGLGMEIVQNRPGGIVEYTFVHSPAYQQTQLGYEQCVQSYNPSTFVGLIRNYPYHVASLMQVSEIAKHEKDYATSGDLLERALFSFGRSLHSTFAANLAKGTARLDFRRPENREFWLACWRYIGNIGQRATYRTAYEWARLLLSLDPDNDPYCMRLVIDQLALRAKQHESLTKLCNSDFFRTRWAELPNIHFSRSLAARALQPNSDEPKKILVRAIEQFPWVAVRLMKELDMERPPRQIWGKDAATDADALHSELYAAAAKDLWKSEEQVAFLIRAATSCSETGLATVAIGREISRDEARFTILTDNRALIGLLPRRFTASIDNAADILPPEDSIVTYQISRGRPSLSDDLGGRAPAEQLLREDPQQFIEELNVFQRFFEMLIPSLAQVGSLTGVELPDELVEEAIQRSHVSATELRACLARLVDLRTLLAAQPDRRVRARDGDEVEMLPDGRLRSSGRSTNVVDEMFASRQSGTSHADEELIRQLMEEDLNEQ